MNSTPVRKQESVIKEKMENDLSNDLCKAVEKNDLSMIRELISKGANVNAYDKNNKLPLQIALQKAFIEITEELIEKGADVNAMIHYNEKNKTLLEFAMEENIADIVLLLVKKGANTIFDNNDETVLHYAAKNGILELVKSMINKGINVDAKTSEGRTPLHLATKYGRFEIVKYLCEIGADVNARTSAGSTPLHFAVGDVTDSSKIVTFLVDNGAEIDIENDYKYTPLQLSLYDKNFKVAKILIEKGANINRIYGNTHYARNITGTLLHWAARSYDGDDIIRFLVENGSDINATERDGRTPLCLLVKHGGTSKMVQFLVEHGADLNNRGGGSPLYWAMYMRDKKLETLLIELGSDVNAPIDSFDDLKAPLHIVRNRSMMELLIDKGANVNICDKYGNTPLHCAEHLSLVKCLVENGADINVRNHEGSTPLHTASNFPIVEYLVEKGANISIINCKGYTPLHFAKNLFIAEYLIEKGADVKAVTMDGKTVLHSIAELYTVYDSNYKNISDLIQLLIKKGININASDKNGNTPLHLCAEQSSIYTEESLIENGADIFAINNEGKRPIDYGYGICANINKSREKILNAVREDDSFKDIKALIFGRLNLCNIVLDSRKTTIFHLMVQNCKAYVINKFFWELQHRQFMPNILLKNGFVDACDVDYWMPIHYAAKKGDSDIVKHLLENGSMYNAETVNCETPLKLTSDDKTKSILNLTEQMFEEVKSGNYAECVKCIDKQSGIFNARDKDGNSPLHLALYHGYTDIIKLLMRHKVNVFQINKEGKTVLHLAIIKASKDIVENLLNCAHVRHQNRINELVNLQAIDGTTALHIAAKHNRIELVQLLLSSGASYNTKNNEGKIPVDLATDADIIALFRLVQELFEDAREGNTEIINKLESLDHNELKMVTSTCARQNYTLKDICSMNEYESIVQQFLEIEKKLKFKYPNKQSLKKESLEEIDEEYLDLGFGLFD